MRMAFISFGLYFPHVETEHDLKIASSHAKSRISHVNKNVNVKNKMSDVNYNFTWNL